MKEIKFRAWIGPEEEELMSKSFSIFEAERILNPFFDQPLMQFTGLLDKNGKEIYEGDIVKWIITRGIIEGGTSKVVYCPETMCFALQDKGVMSVWGMDEVIELEIIGNIYENPELITNNK